MRFYRFLLPALLAGCATTGTAPEFPLAYDSAPHGTYDILYLGQGGRHEIGSAGLHGPAGDPDERPQPRRVFPDEILGQPLANESTAVWSADGRRIAAAGVLVPTREFPRRNIVAIAEPASGSGAIVWSDPVRTPFLLAWSPSGRRVAVLSGGSNTDLWLELVEIDRAVDAMETAGSIDEVLEGRVLVAEGAPLYFDWAPPGDAVVVHTRGRVFVTEPDGDRRAELSGNPGTFRAPAARGDGRGVTLVLDSAGDHRIATVDLTGREIRHSAAPAGAALAWGPGGEYLATLRYGPAGPIGVLDIVDTRSTVRNISMVPVQTRTPGRQTALAMEWSTTEAAMLVLRRNRESESTNPELPLRWEWIRLDGERPRQDIIVAFRPTPDFIQGRLPFFDQYARFLSRIAPDTRAVTYSRLAADGPVVEVFEFESKQTVRIGRGVHPTWRPVDPNGR